jgi:NAD(P)-dependent dehydrogenase (short-subunit alcohol dehydrogenase family)
MSAGRELEGQVALVTGGGRGIGAGIARELAAAGARVAVAARTTEQVDEVAREIDGLPLELDVTDQAAVERAIAETKQQLGPLTLLVANAGIGNQDGATWEMDPADWWRVLEVNVLGVHLCCRAYPASKAAVCRYGETLNNELGGRIPVFFFSPGLVKTKMTGDAPDDAPWTPPELAPRLVRVLATGRADALSGRYIHAEHDDIDDLISRADEIRDRDLNAIRVQR